jgi:ComF family protein
MHLARIRKFFLDLFFPKKCLGCGKYDTYLCSDCFDKIKLLENNSCFFCGKISWQGKICLEHKNGVYLDRVISATNYADPLIRELIKCLKYRFAQELAEPLSQLLIKTLKDLKFEFCNLDFVIIPVPLHKYRLRKRGFNQAELIAQKIANYFNLPINTNILGRTIYTEPQANLKDNTEKRLNNIQNAFTINPAYKNLIKDKIIILIDDVITTGGTLIEAGKILKQNNAKEVWTLTVAKG